MPKERKKYSIYRHALLYQLDVTCFESSEGIGGLWRFKAEETDGWADLIQGTSLFRVVCDEKYRNQYVERVDSLLGLSTPAGYGQLHAQQRITQVFTIPGCLDGFIGIFNCMPSITTYTNTSSSTIRSSEWTGRETMQKQEGGQSPTRPRWSRPILELIPFS